MFRTAMGPFVWRPTPMRRTAKRVVAAALMIFPLAACGASDVIIGVGGAVDQVNISVTPVVGSATKVDLMVGDSAVAVAAAVDALGLPVGGAAVTWASTAPTVATVSGSGVIRAVAAGEATITATADGVAGTLPVTVQDTPAPAPGPGG